MKILQVNCVYNDGSTGKIVYDIHNGLRERNIDSVVCYGRGKIVNEKNIYKICGELESHIYHLWANLTGIMYASCWFSTIRLINIIKKEKPDVVHLHCINGYFVNIYKILEWLKENNIKTILTLHAEFMYTGGCGHSLDCNQWISSNGCGYFGCPRWRKETKSLFLDNTHRMWKKMKKSFNGFNNNIIIVSVSPWLMNRASKSIILSGFCHKIVLNGIDNNIFHPFKEDVKKEIRKKLGVENKFVVFHATASFINDVDHLKGGYYIVELAKMMPEVQFVVAGTYQVFANVPQNLKLLGKVDDKLELAKLYSMADLTILTSKRETFAMTIAESLSCGTPVIGFKAGAPETVAINKYCKFVEQGDLDSLCNIIRNVRMNVDYDLCIRKYSKEEMIEQYVKLYETMRF